LAHFQNFEKCCISEPFKVQTKVKEIQTGTNDSLSSAVGPISISFKMANFSSWCLSEIFKYLLKWVIPQYGDSAKIEALYFQIL